MSNRILSDTVYGALYNIIMGYDGLSIGKELGNVDLGDLNELRSNPDMWRVGRQITESKNSFDYIKELCRQSFIGAFPSRNGVLTFSAWRQQRQKNCAVVRLKKLSDLLSERTPDTISQSERYFSTILSITSISSCRSASIEIAAST